MLISCGILSIICYTWRNTLASKGKNTQMSMILEHGATKPINDADSV